jgi:hypothetical protein
MNSSPTENENAPLAGGASKITKVSKLVNFKADGDLVQTKFTRVWSAWIVPAATKLVLMAMTNYSNADGTSISPSVASVARHCCLSEKQARRHIHALLKMGVLVKTSAPNRARQTYKLDFAALERLQTTPTGGSRKTPIKTPIYSHRCPNLLPPTGVNPKNPKVLRGEGGVPPGRLAPASGTAGQIALPGDLSRELFDALVANGPNKPERVKLLAQQAFELAAQGHDVENMAQQAIEMGWKRWGRPEAPTAPLTPRKTTRASRTAPGAGPAPMSREAREHRALHLGSGWGDADGGVQP